MRAQKRAGGGAGYTYLIWRSAAGVECRSAPDAWRHLGFDAEESGGGGGGGGEEEEEGGAGAGAGGAEEGGWSESETMRLFAVVGLAHKPGTGEAHHGEAGPQQENDTKT